MNKLIFLFLLFFIGCGTNYEYAVRNHTPDSLQEKKREYILQAIEKANLLANNENENEDVIRQIERTAGSLFDVPTEGLIYYERVLTEIQYAVFIPYDKLTPLQKLIFAKQKEAKK